MDKECEACYFYEQDPTKPFCKRMDRQAMETSQCNSGPLIRLPKTGLDLRNMIILVEKQWRKEGE